MSDKTEAEKQLGPEVTAEFWEGYEPPVLPLRMDLDAAIEQLARELFIHIDDMLEESAFRHAERFYRYADERRLQKHKDAWMRDKLKRTSEKP